MIKNILVRDHASPLASNFVMSHSPVVRTEGLTRFYGRRTGVEEVDLDIPPGQIFGFLGPNGAGKTTTIRLLLGFLRPSRGKATISAAAAGRDERKTTATPVTCPATSVSIPG